MSNRLQTYKTLEKEYLRKSKGNQKEKVKDLLKLYKDEKIFSKITIQRELNRYLGQSFKNEGERELHFYKTMTKYLDVRPSTDKRREKRVEQKSEKIEALIEKAEARTKVNYTVQAILYSLTPQARTKKKKIADDIYYQITKRSFDVKASKTFPEDIYKNYIIRNRGKDQRQWKKALKIMLTNEDFDDMYLKGYIDAIYIMDYDKLPKKGKYDPLDEGLRSQDKISIYHKYIETHVNLEYENLKDAIENKDYIENECWLNAITDHYKNLFQHKKITRETILTLINKTEDNIKDGISVNDVMPFFQTYGIQLRVFDYIGNCIAKYEPDVRNHNYRALYCMVKGNHIYTLNDTQSLKQIDYDEEVTITLPVSSNYHTNEKQETPAHKMIDNLDDILNILKTSDEKKTTTVYLVLRNDNLLEMLYNALDSGYEPNIKYQAGKLSLISLKLNKVTFVIKTQQLRPEVADEEIAVNTEEKYNNMSKTMSDFNKALFKNNHKSYYTSSDTEYLNCYRTIVPSGVLRECNGECSEIDVSKAFTSALADIVQIPIFNEFDSWKSYNKLNTINALSLYIVKTNTINLFFNKRYCLVYGKYLKHFVNDCDVIYYKEPSFVKVVKYSDIVKNLFNTSLSDNEEEDKFIKKTIANVNCGLLEKGVNKSQKSFIFDTADEAYYYRDMYGGTISVLKKLEVTEELIENPLDAGLNMGHNTSNFVEEETDKKYYILNIKKEKQLENGFRYIKELLLQGHNFKMYHAYKKLTEANVNVFSVKTDAFMIQPEHVDIAKSVLPFSKKIGDWRVSKECCPPHPLPDYLVIENELVTLEESKTIRLKINDEWDVNELCKHVIDNKRVMIRARLPGSGKSYICETLASLGYKVLFVCPTNKLAQKYKEHGLTGNKFYGIGFSDNTVKDEGKIKRFDSSEYDVIVFDEIYFSSVRMLARIRKFCLDNPEKIVVATGDTSQLPPIVGYTNMKDYATYADECINAIFPYEIYLKENKRLKTQEDKDKLEQIYNDIFNPKIELETTMKKYFNFTKSLITSNKGIAYMNDTCENVSKHVRKHLNKNADYEVGEVLICREYLVLKKVGTFNVNFEYRILKEIDDNTLLIKNLATDKIYEVPKNIIKKHFIFSYCSTCHSTQGQTINENITIYDWKFYYTTREWLWTAITRATSLDNVYFHDYKEPALNKDLILSYFKRRVEGYIRQDLERSDKSHPHQRCGTNAKRLPAEVKDNYVTAEWLMGCVNKLCSRDGCDNMLYIGFRDGNTYTNITAQRSDNSLYHTLDNIEPMCKICNCSLSNRELNIDMPTIKRQAGCCIDCGKKCRGYKRCYECLGASIKKS